MRIWWNILGNATHQNFIRINYHPGPNADLIDCPLKKVKRLRLSSDFKNF